MIANLSDIISKIEKKKKKKKHQDVVNEEGQRRSRDN